MGRPQYSNPRNHERNENDGSATRFSHTHSVHIHRHPTNGSLETQSFALFQWSSLSRIEMATSPFIRVLFPVVFFLSFVFLLHTPKNDDACSRDLNDCTKSVYHDVIAARRSSLDSPSEAKTEDRSLSSAGAKPSDALPSTQQPEKLYSPSPLREKLLRTEDDVKPSESTEAPTIPVKATAAPTPVPSRPMTTRELLLESDRLCQNASSSFTTI